MREALLALAGVTLESESDTESETDQAEPILVEALLESALQGELQLPPFSRCRRKPYSVSMCALESLCLECLTKRNSFKCQTCDTSSSL